MVLDFKPFHNDMTPLLWIRSFTNLWNKVRYIEYLLCFIILTKFSHRSFEYRTVASHCIRLKVTQCDLCLWAQLKNQQKLQKISEPGLIWCPRRFFCWVHLTFCTFFTRIDRCLQQMCKKREKTTSKMETVTEKKETKTH